MLQNWQNISNGKGSISLEPETEQTIIDNYQMQCSVLKKGRIKQRRLSKHGGTFLIHQQCSDQSIY